MQAGPQRPEEPQLSVYQPQQPSVYQPQQPSVYQPQQPAVYKPQEQIRKPKQNSQQPRQDNPNVKDSFQTKTSMWDFVSPENGKRFESGITSSRGIVMQAGPQPPAEPQPSVYQPGYSSIYQTQRPSYQPQQPSVYKPQEQIRKLKQNSQKPPQSNAKDSFQTKTGMWDFVVPENGKRFESGIASSQGIVMQAGPQPLEEPQPSVHQPGVSFTSVYQPQQPSVYQPQQPSVYQPQQQIRRPKQNSQSNPNAKDSFQTKAGMWDFVSPKNEKIESGVSSSRELMQAVPQPSVYQPQFVGIEMKPAVWEFFSADGAVSGPNVQTGSPSKHQQVGIQIQPAMWELYSPDRVSGPTNFNVQMTVPPRTREVPLASPQRPRWQRPLV
ncbi:hypothetical protein EYF80_017153 [Liparis tanakae]|uniref:Uncharacterized protein n=1 Tax=Liparis tanakae TaxID=230148 RepID=A0A4Z2I395_9TELE|nr:hypothetical protein EYF80_017153 [Liparis tanakae]